MDSPHLYSRFGRHATPEELEAIYARLMQEKDDAIRVRLLWVFRRAPLPRLPDDRMGEVGYAFVVPKLGSGDDRATLSQQISGWARENMANYKVPRTVEIIDALPTNASGKVLKYELRDRAVAALDTARSATGQSEGAS